MSEPLRSEYHKKLHSKFAKMRLTLHKKSESITGAFRAYLTLLDKEHETLVVFQDDLMRKRPIFPSKERAVSANLQTIRKGLAIVEEEIQFAEYGAGWRKRRKQNDHFLTIPLGQ